MNTYSKYCPNVFLAKCSEQHDKGDVIVVVTRYGKENECVVFNLIFTKDDYYYYSIIRADGFNQQVRAENKASKLQGYAQNAKNKSDQAWEDSQEGRDFLVLGEPIKIGHHSEKRHRALIERNNNRMDKAVEFSKKSEQYAQKADYWEGKKDVINLSMPESIGYFEHRLKQAKEKHQGLKDGSIARSHSYSLTYAKKEVNEAVKNYELALKLWS